MPSQHKNQAPAVPLYHHKTDGGAEYLTDKFILCPNGHKEGIFEGAGIVIRIDGDVTKDAEIIRSSDKAKIAALVEALEGILPRYQAAIRDTDNGHGSPLPSEVVAISKASAALASANL